MRYRPSIVPLVAIVMSLTACSGHDAPGTKKPPVVKVVTVERSPYRQTVSLPGRTTSFLTSPVTPQVGGIIQKRLFAEGTPVKAGDVLYQIDPAPYQAALDSARADLLKAQAAVVAARPQAERDQELARIDAVSKETLEAAQATLKADEADVAAGQAAVETARINLGYTQVKAPVAGTISASSVTPGALVTANQSTALATIYAYDPMYVDVTQSSTQFLALRRDLASGRLKRDASGAARITLQLEDGSDYGREGSLQFAGVHVDETTGTITLRGIVPNPDGLLLPGMYVHADVEQGVDELALMVPQQGVTHDPKGAATALIVDAQGKVEQRTLGVAGTQGANWVVDSGLAPGDRVIVEGSQDVKPGAAVTVQAAAPATR